MHTQLYSDLESRIKSELLSTACKALFDLTSGTTVYRQAAILDSLYLFIFSSYSKNFSHLQFPWPTDPSPSSAYWNCTCPWTTAERPFNTYLPTKPLFPLNTHRFLFPSFTSLCFAHSELWHVPSPLQWKLLKGRGAGILTLQAPQDLTLSLCFSVEPDWTWGDTSGPTSEKGGPNSLLFKQWITT